MNFQQALDRTLRDKGIKGVELAAAVGCSQGQISQLKNGGECTLAFQSRLLDALERFGAKDYLISLWLGLDSDRPPTIAEAIALLKQAELTDRQVADLLSISAHHIRKLERVPIVA